MTEEEKKAIETMQSLIDGEYGSVTVCKKTDIKTLLNLIKKLKVDNTALENTRDICPVTNTSGLRCSLKELDNTYKAEYMQIPFDILTEENLDRLEKHCKKAIHYERGNIREEHEITLALLYKYQDSIPKEAIRELLKNEYNEIPMYKLDREYLAKNLKSLLGE